MRQATVGIFLTFFLVLISSAQTVGESDRSRLQGTWDLLSGGKLVATLVIDIDGNRYVYEEFTLKEEGALVVDPNKSPKQMDFQIKKGPDQDKTRRCIYRFSGSTLELLMAYPDSNRPADFKDDGEKGHILWKGSKR